MNKHLIIPLNLSLLGSILVSCGHKEIVKSVTIINTADFERKQETVAIPMKELISVVQGYELSDVLVKEAATDTWLVSQWIDNDMDGQMDELLFQVNLSAGQEKEFVVLRKENGKELQPETEHSTYSRFVPERTDDYTWENDKVAFRTYGPEAQRLVEEGEQGGTLSSGIDLWLKSVNYPIIDSWYAKNDQDPGYYHIDHGEGYDPYHVGSSRGTGGIGIWVSDSLHTSGNFTAYRTIATGPIRTLFELDYAPWSEFGVKETKRISLDLGSNFSRFEIILSPEKNVPNYAIGITLHDGTSEESLDMENGTFRHWEFIDDAFVGEGIVIAPALVTDAFAWQSFAPDQSQLLILTHPAQEKLIYYAGFGWTKSNQISGKADWDAELARQAQIVANPLKIIIK